MTLFTSDSTHFNNPYVTTSFKWTNENTDGKIFS